MKRCPLWTAAAVFSSFLLFQSSLFAQVDRGAISGQVMDSSGAAVPGAKVTITNADTNQAFTVQTDDTGTYVANLLRVGTYKVTADKEGFRTTVRTEVEVGVNQVVRVDFTLQVGTLTQTVEVTGAPPLVQSETSSLGTIENEQRIVDLPLNQRNFIQLAYLGPGANSGMTGANAAGAVPENERANEALSVNGLRVSNNNFLLDGVDNNEFGNGVVVALPPPDALQEFRIEENSMAAEFGRGGAAVNVVLRSGTNQLHGGAYEFVRNDKFDARNFRDAKKPPFRRNQFGFLLGGPIVKDKTFIFGDFQVIRVREGLTFVSTVPTLKERNGDFSEFATLLYDPLTTDPNTGARQLLNPTNPYVVPANRMDAAGAAVVALYPMPTNQQLFNNYLSNPGLSNDQESFDVRVDHKISDKDQFFAHMSYGDVDNLRPTELGGVGGDPASFGGKVKDRDQHWGAGWTRTLSPTLINDLHGGFFRYHVAAVPPDYGQNRTTTLGIPYTNRGDINSSGLAQFDPAGFQDIGDTLWFPEFVVENIFQLADTLSWMHGKHSFKFGVDFRRQQRNFFQEQAPKGWFQFFGIYSEDLTTSTGGNPLADLFLGIPSFVEQDELKGEYPTRYWDLAEFVQDDYRVTPNLTLNLGLRYEVDSPPSGRIGNFDLNKAVVLVGEGQGAVPHAGIGFDKNNFAPRIGLAWSPFGGKRTVVRSAFGIFYSSEGNIFTDLGINPPFVVFDQRVFNPLVIPPQSQFLSSGLASTLVFPDPNNPTGSVETSGSERVIPTILEWNFNVEQQFSQNWMLQVAYVGTRATHLWNHYADDFNQPLQPLDSNFSVGNFGRRYYNQRPELQSIFPLDFPQFSLLYHSFQTSLTKRFSNGFNALISYTFAKNLGNADGNVSGSVQNAYNIAAEKGPVPPDLRHRFAASYLYELPFGNGKKFGSGAGGAAERVIGGWQVAGITVLHTGESKTAVLSFDPTNSGSFSPRPDRIHNPYDFSFDTARQQALGCSNPGHQTLDCWFNQAAFAIPSLAPGQSFAHMFGNGGSNNLRGPDQVNFDFAILKNFRITERHALQFRAEFFNLFNHPQFTLPATTVDVPGGASISSTLPDNQREIQFALKWTF